MEQNEKVEFKEVVGMQMQKVKMDNPDLIGKVVCNKCKKQIGLNEEFWLVPRNINMLDFTPDVLCEDDF